MSKGLDALERIKQAEYFIDFELDAKIKDDYKTELAIIEKELKALEIIKEKPQATLWLIQHCDKEMEYEDMLFLFKEDVTKEQFELLKEVLLCH